MNDVQWDDLDPGIVKAVRALRDAGLNTMGSCQGGHAYPKELPWITIEPGPGVNAGMEQIVASQAISGAGFHGYTISLRQDTWYQSSGQKWHTHPHNGETYLFIEFWNKENQGEKNATTQ